MKSLNQNTKLVTYVTELQHVLTAITLGILRATLVNKLCDSVCCKPQVGTSWHMAWHLVPIGRHGMAQLSLLAGTAAS